MTSVSIASRSTASSGTSRRTALLDLRLCCAGETLRAFTARADPGDADKLDQLLAGAVRRLGAEAKDIDLYELEVRLDGDPTLLTTFVSTV